MVTDFESNTPRALLNIGDGRFGPAVSLPSGGAVLSIAATDINEDGGTETTSASRSSHAQSQRNQ